MGEKAVFNGETRTYEQYLGLLDELIARRATTGPNQSETLAAFTKLNRQRMRRLDKTVTLLPDVVSTAAKAVRRVIWFVITEGWCGDAAQNLPIIEKIARASSSIETRYILRDENLDFMDRFLTNGARAIPKLIAVDIAGSEVLWTWGARPAEAQRLYASLKERGTAKGEIMEALQRWYIEDRGTAAQTEIAELIQSSGPHSLDVAAMS